MNRFTQLTIILLFHTLTNTSSVEINKNMALVSAGLVVGGIGAYFLGSYLEKSKKQTFENEHLQLESCKYKYIPNKYIKDHKYNLEKHDCGPSTNYSGRNQSAGSNRSGHCQTEGGTCSDSGTSYNFFNIQEGNKGEVILDAINKYANTHEIKEVNLGTRGFNLCEGCEKTVGNMYNVATIPTTQIAQITSCLLALSSALSLYYTFQKTE